MARAGSAGFEVWLRGARGQRLRHRSSPRCGATSSSRARYADCFAGARAPLRRAARSLRARHDDRRRSRALFARAARRARPAARRDRAAARAARRCTGELPGRRAARGRPRDRRARWASTSAPGASTTPCTRSRRRPRARDIRVTSRFDDHSLTGLFALMHEVGHGLYERGIDPALARTTLDSGVSLGVHESQSRLWENLVGRCRAVLEPLAAAPARGDAARRCGDVDLDDFLRAINVVRADADPRRGRRGDVLAARHPALRARARAHRGHARPGRPAAGVGGQDARAARHRGARRPARRPAGHPLVARGSSATSRRTRSATSSPRSCGARRAPTCRELDDDIARRPSTAPCARGSSRRSTATAAA